MAQLTPLGLIKIMAQVTAIMVISILGEREIPGGQPFERELPERVQ